MAKNAVASAASTVKAPPKKGASDNAGQDLLRSSAGLKRLFQQARERGTVTLDQINGALPEDEVSPDQLDELITAFEDQGIVVARGEDGGGGEGGEVEAKEAGEDDDGGEIIEAEDLGRTDDPVRMYLREMGSIELLSREGEIEIAKRIEAGRNMVIEALCESPLTMRAIIAWRDAIGEGKVLLRDVIDLEATYGGAPQVEGEAERDEDEAKPADDDLDSEVETKKADKADEKAG